jgi:hypothetical protein
MFELLFNKFFLTFKRHYEMYVIIDKNISFGQTANELKFCSIRCCICAKLLEYKEFMRLLTKKMNVTKASPLMPLNVLYIQGFSFKA